MPGAVRYVLGMGWDASGNKGWAIRSDSSDRFLVRYGHTTGESNLGTFSASTSTQYLLCVYEVASKLYFRVNSTEVANSGSSTLQVADTNSVKFNSNSSGSNDSFGGYMRNAVWLTGYSTTESTALTEIDSDFDDIITAGSDVEFSTISGDLNGTVSILITCDEYSDGTSAVQRDDTSGNSKHFSDANTTASINDADL